MTALDDYLARRAALDAQIAAERSLARKEDLRQAAARLNAKINYVRSRQENRVKIERYCTCGAVLRADIPRERKAQALGAWYAAHDGPGHADCDAATAEAARMGTNTGMGRESARKR